MSSKKSELKSQFSKIVAEVDTDYSFEELMLSMRILSEVEKIMEESGMTKNELANLLGVSAPYITMLFRGEKILNLEKIARLQDILNIDFRITAESRKGSYESDLINPYAFDDVIFSENHVISESGPTYSRARMKIAYKNDKIVA